MKKINHLDMDGMYIGVNDRHGKPIRCGDIMIMDTEDGLYKFKVVFAENDREECEFLSGFTFEMIEELDSDDYEDAPYFDVIKEEK